MGLVSTNQLAECRRILRRKDARDELIVIPNHQDASCLVVLPGELVQDQVRDTDRARKCCDAKERTRSFFFGDSEAEHHEADCNGNPDDTQAKILVLGRFRVAKPVNQLRTQLLPLSIAIRIVSCICWRVLYRNQKNTPSSTTGATTDVKPIHSPVTVLSPLGNSSAKAVFTP